MGLTRVEKEDNILFQNRATFQYYDRWTTASSCILHYFREIVFFLIRQVFELISIYSLHLNVSRPLT